MAADSLVFWTTLVLGLISGGSMIGALRSRQAASALYFQRIFVCCLVGTGAATIFALSLHNSSWLSCGVSCACQCVFATIDTSKEWKHDAVTDERVPVSATF